MNKITFTILFIIVSISYAYAGHLHPERYYQIQWCADHNGQMEYELDDQTRVDCLTDQYAIEFDFASKWAEAIGQSLYYASKIDRKAGIVLIMEDSKDIRFMFRIWEVIDNYHLPIETWSIYPNDFGNDNK